MTSFFLKAKHWHLLLLMWGTPFVFMLITILMSAFAEIHIPIMGLYAAVMIITAGSVFEWFWAIGVGLHRKLPENTNLKLTKFKWFFWIPLTYMAVLVFFISTGGMFETPTLFHDIPGIVLVLPLHLFSMFCIMYLMYFCARTLKSIELGRSASFSESVLEFFLLWFYMIGVFILQPKINKIASE